MSKFRSRTTLGGLGFTIPMRGNEQHMILMAVAAQYVYDPHEG